MAAKICRTPIKTHCTLRFPLVHSHISFGLSVYDSTCNAYLHMPQALQNLVSRIILFAKKYDNVTFAYFYTDSLNITKAVKYRTAVLTYKLRNGTIMLPRISLFLWHRAAILIHWLNSTIIFLTLEKTTGFSASHVGRLQFQIPLIHLLSCHHLWQCLSRATDILAYPSIFLYFLFFACA